MKGLSAQQAGSALFWRMAELAFVKGMFLIRLLILARLLTPEDFGLMAIATVAIGLLMKITDMGMVPALIQRAEADESHYHSAWSVGFIRALLVTVVVVLTAPVIADLFGEPKATAIIAVLAIRPLLDATANIRVAELTRNLRFRSLACIHVPAAAVELLVSLTLARSFGVWVLVIGALSGSIATVIASYAVAPWRPRFLLRSDAIRPLIRYGRWIFVTGLVALAGRSALQIVISRRLGANELGLYFLAAKLAFLPYEVISEVVGSVAFPLYSRLQSDLVQTSRTFRTILTGMVSLLVPVYVLIIVFAPSLVENALGSKWAGSASLIQILAIVGIVGMFGDATGPVFRGVGQPEKILAVETVQSVLLIVLAWYLAGQYGLIGAGLSWLIAIAASQIFSAVFLSRLLPRPFTGLASPVISIMLCSIASALVGLMLIHVLTGLSGLIVASLIAAIATGLFLWGSDRRFKLGLAMNLSQAFPQIANLLRFSSSHNYRASRHSES
jgi:O-antigen/teichoic acid export membrane protein